MADDPTKHRDEISGTETTGHEWDGIHELNTPLPRWWLWTFYITIVWAIGYTIAYPAWPLIHTATRGVLGYSSRAQLQAELAQRAKAWQPYVNKIASLDLKQIAANEELSRFAQAGGAAIFRTTCSQCHGSGAQGAPGYPNLLDDAWLWGGTLDAIRTTITHGIRYSADPDTRFSQMPAFGRQGILNEGQIAAVADYVLSLSGRAQATEEGKKIFADNCAACHGPDGKGNKDLGAPNLTDAIWLYGGDRATIMGQIHNGRNSVMPAWTGKLTDVQIKEVTLYVHGLGGGQ